MSWKHFVLFGTFALASCNEAGKDTSTAPDAATQEANAKAWAQLHEERKRERAEREIRYTEYFDKVCGNTLVHMYLNKDKTAGKFFIEINNATYLYFMEIKSNSSDAIISVIDRDHRTQPNMFMTDLDTSKGTSFNYTKGTFKTDSSDDYNVLSEYPQRARIDLGAIVAIDAILAASDRDFVYPHFVREGFQSYRDKKVFKLSSPFEPGR